MMKNAVFFLELEEKPPNTAENAIYVQLYVANLVFESFRVSHQ